MRRAWVALFLLLASCAPEPGLVVEVRAGEGVPEPLDALKVVIQRDGVPVAERTFALEGAALPQTVAVTSRGKTTGAVLVVVEGRRGERIEARGRESAELSTERPPRQVLVVLSRLCIGETCGCVPKKCEEVGAECGLVADGCDGVASCGGCPQGQVCGAKGPNRCGEGSCTPTTCAAEGAECGQLSDECAGTLECGGCTLPETCGGGGEANRCGCTPEGDDALCARLDVRCGPLTAPDSCGQSRTVPSCGTCTDPESCGGGGVNGHCGCAESDGAFCARVGVACGPASGTDGCGQTRSVASCGGCTAPQSCGGGGTAGQCGCTPESDGAFCARMGVACGAKSGTDNCGASRDVPSCGGCTPPESCGGGGTPGQCGCTDTDGAFCARNGRACGTFSGTDACGASRTAYCGPCNAYSSCDAGQCVCNAGTTSCASGCSDLLTDRQNCGGCGKVCPNAKDCVGGKCLCTEPSDNADGHCCPPGWTFTYVGGPDGGPGSRPYCVLGPRGSSALSAALADCRAEAGFTCMGVLNPPAGTCGSFWGTSSDPTPPVNEFVRVLTPALSIASCSISCSNSCSCAIGTCSCPLPDGTNYGCTQPYYCYSDPSAPRVATCASFADCAPNEVCVSGGCVAGVRKPCCLDTDCPDGGTCEKAGTIPFHVGRCL